MSTTDKDIYLAVARQHQVKAHTNSISRTRFKRDDRVVNLPQESKEYSNEEYSGDSYHLDNDNFITRGTTIQDKNKNKELDVRAPRVKTLTDFIQEAVKILNTYEDTAFEDFFHVLDNEIRKYHYRGCKFAELTQNSNTKRLLARSLKLIRGKTVSFTKHNINEMADMIRDGTYDKNVKELLDYINSLYKNTELTFHSVLNELNYYRNTKSLKTHNNLVRVIRGGVRAVLFNPYTELNSNTRRELKERIDIFWKHFKNNPASSAEINEISNTDTVIGNEVKNPEKEKNDPQIKLKRKRERFVYIDNHDEQLHRDETEKDETSNESGEQITNYNTDEILSGQSLDSSSNSIKNSQERREEYNTERYMTLYTEEITYKAKTTNKTEIIPVSASVMTRRPKVKKRPMATATSRERDVLTNRTEKIGILRAQSRSKDKQKNVEIISQYDAVIDVQLANTDFLKSLRMLEPAELDTM